MTIRCGRPGMAPSPNQKIVLDMLVRMTNEVEGGGHFPYFGFTIDEVTKRLADAKLGGITMDQNPALTRQQSDGWIPWHRSTVRDHLNDLVLKDLVVKRVEGYAYYLPR